MNSKTTPLHLSLFGALPFCGLSHLLVLLTALLVLWATPAGAQTQDTSSIYGRVQDERGASIGGARVKLTNTSTGLVREVQTNADGDYSFTALPLTGLYSIVIESSGFAAQSVEAIELRAGRPATVDVSLTPQAASAEVTVTGSAGEIATDSPELSTRLDLKKIEETPVLGRKMTNLVQLDSSVKPARGTGDLFLNNFLFVINGGGRRQPSFSIDGSTGDDAWGRQTVFTNVPFAAIQEFTVITNSASAEYGRTNGGVININTKTGTNDYHVDLRGTFRPGGIQARAPLSAQDTEDTLKQLSGMVSGPIVTDRTHFLIGGEFSDQLRDSTITSPLARGVFRGRYRQELGIFRLDHLLNEKNLLTGRINFDRISDTNPADAIGGLSLPSAARTFYRRAYTGQLAETATLSPSLVNVARFEMLVGSPITQFIPVSPSTQFVRPGVSTEGESRSGLLLNHQYEFSDVLSWVHAAHTVRFGGNATFSSSGGYGQEFGSGFVLGQFTFKSGGNPANPATPTSSLTLGDVQSFQQSFGNQNYNVREWLWSMFVQDDYRVRRDLTLNLGLRYERQTFTDDQNNLSPRVGFAYNVLGDNKTVIRGSYGIYYSEIRANAGAGFALSGPEGIFTFSAQPGQLGFPTSFNPIPGFPAGAVLPPRNIVIRPGRSDYYNQFFDVSKLRFYPDKLLNPYTQQSVLGIERELPGGWILSADYVNAHTIGIDRNVDLNSPTPFIRTAQGQTRTAAQADATRPIKPVPNGFRRIEAVVNEASALYNGLQVRLNKRFANRFSLLATYTWSHTINTVEPDAPGGAPNDANQLGAYERGDSTLDQRHRAVISGFWQLPYRFMVGGVTTLTSGRPFNITTGADNNGDGSNSDRPVINGSVIGRNTGLTSPIYDTSLFVSRDFMLTERVRLEVRAEGFNIFNHSNVVGRNAVFGNALAPSASFGLPVGGLANVDPGRQFQFQLGLRY